MRHKQPTKPRWHPPKASLRRHQPQLDSQAPHRRFLDYPTTWEYPGGSHDRFTSLSCAKTNFWQSGCLQTLLVMGLNVSYFSCGRRRAGGKSVPGWGSSECKNIKGALWQLKFFNGKKNVFVGFRLQPILGNVQDRGKERNESTMSHAQICICVRRLCIFLQLCSVW